MSEAEGPLNRASWYPHGRWMVLVRGTSHLEMDDNWRYPYFRTPPYDDGTLSVYR